MDQCNDNQLFSYYHRFVNALIIKYCVNNTVVEEKCGSDASNTVERLKRVILPNMDEWEVSKNAYGLLLTQVFLKLIIIRQIT